MPASSESGVQGPVLILGNVLYFGGGHVGWDLSCFSPQEVS